MVLCSFNENLDQFAIISNDNRLKIFDTQTGTLLHQFVSNNHLSETYTCISWSRFLSKKSKNKITKNQQLIALGTHRGNVIIWDVVKGEILKTLTASKLLNKKNSGNSKYAFRINAVSFSPTDKLKTIYCCGNNQNIMQFNIKTGAIINKWKADKQKVSAITVSEDGETLISKGGSGHIKVWNLSTNKLNQKFICSSTGDIRNIKLTKDSKYLFTASPNQRFIHVYQPNSDNDDIYSNVANLVSKVNPFHIDISKYKQQKNKIIGNKRKRNRSNSLNGTNGIDSPSETSVSYHVLSVSKKGVMIWDFNPQSNNNNNNNSSSKSVFNKDGVIELSKKDKQVEEYNILYATFSAANKILIARGSSIKPLFEEVTYFKDNNIIDKSLLETKNQQKNLLLNNNKEQDKKNAANLIEVPQDDQINKNVTTKLDIQTQKLLSKQENNEEGATFSEQIKILKKQNNLLLDNKKKQKIKPSANSLQIVLSQSIKSGDNHLIDSCLSVQDPLIIHNTIQRLSAVNIIPFIDIVVTKFQNNPNRANQLIPWIRAILIVHASYLISVKNKSSVQSLFSLYETVESRVSVFNQFLKLSGRMDLLMSQISTLQQQQQQQQNQSKKHITYNEDEILSDSSEEEYDDDDEEMEKNLNNNNEDNSEDENDSGDDSNDDNSSDDEDEEDSDEESDDDDDSDEMSDEESDSD